MEKIELTTYSRNRALQLAALLVECGYVTMISQEEDLWVLDCIPTYLSDYKYREDREANRNGIVFMDRDDFYDQYTEIIDEDTDNIDELVDESVKSVDD